MRYQTFIKVWLFIFGLVSSLIVLTSVLHSKKSKTDIKFNRRSVSEIREQRNFDILKLFERTDQVLHFFENNFQQLNADGLFGIRIAQGTLTNKLYKIEDFDLTWLVQSFKNRLELLGKKAYESVKKDEPEYASAFDAFISDSYFTDFVKKTSIKSFIQQSSRNDDIELETSFNEKFSDSCYLSLLNKKKHCSIDSKCLEYYAEPSASAYYLTHQLLFLMITQKSSCGELVLLNLVTYLAKNSKAEADLKHIIERNPVKEDIKYALNEYFCGRIYMEVKATNQTFFETGRLPHGIDLFIEQVLLCTLTNVEEFKTNDFLELIYLFQNQYGCFGGDDDNYRDNVLNLLKRKHNTNQKEMERLYSFMIVEEFKRHSQQGSRKRRGRVRREDRLMNNGCSSHATGLALGYYSTILAVNLENSLKKITKKYFI